MSRLAVITVVLVPTLGLASDAAWGRAGARPTVVLLAPRDRPAASRSLVQAVRSQLSDVPVRLQVHGIASLPGDRPSQLRLARSASKGAAVVLWHDPRARQACALHVAPEGGRLACRRVGTAGEEGHYEAVAIMARSAVRAHRPVARSRRRRPTGRAEERPERPPTPDARRVWLALGAAYALDVFAPPGAPVAHGLRLSALMDVHRYGSVFVGFRVEPQIKGAAELSALKIQRYPVDLGAQAIWRRGRWELGGRMALNLIVARARGVDGASDDGKALTGWHFALAVHGLCGFRPHPRLLIWLGIGAKVFVVNDHYRADNGQILAPWLVQPSALLGVRVNIL